MTKKHVSLLIVFVLLFTTLFSSFVFAADAEWIEADEITINVKAHVQSFGDQTHKGEDGMVAFGTEGKAKRLEKFDVTLEGAPANMELVGMAHVQSFGDMPQPVGTFAAGAIGTEKLAKRIEGVAFKLVKKGTDTLYPGYRVGYAVHMQSFGWGVSDKVNSVVGKNFDLSSAKDFVYDGTFAGTRGLSKRIESVSLIIYKEAKLAVESVSADNLKQVVVEFNQAVNAETIVDANFTLKKGNVTIPVSAVADESGKAAILTVEPKEDTKGLENQGKYTLTVDKVKNLSGTAIVKTTEEFKAFDAELPEVLAVEYTGPRSFVVRFSEPIKKTATGTVSVKTDKSTLSVNQTFTGFGTNEIAVNTYSTFTDGVEYTITVQGFEDFAGYKNIILSEGITYNKDVAPPVASIEKAEQEYVVVNFNKPVKGLTKEHFYHTFTAWTAIKLTATNSFDAAELKTTDSVSKVYVWFNNTSTAVYKAASRPLPSGAVDFIIKGKVGSVEIKDNWDNAFATSSYVLNISADTAKPEVKEITVKTEQSITVEFTKDVKFTKDNIEILADNGAKIDGLSLTVTGSGKKYDVDFGKNLAGKTIIVNIKGVEDTTLKANVLDSYSATIEVTDKTAPKISSITFDSNKDDRALYVFYNEAVDPETALVAGNYYYVNGGTYTKLTEDPSFYTGNTVVKIPLTETQAGKITTGKGNTQLFVTSVKDLAGNAISATLHEIDVKDSYFPEIDKAEAVALDKIEVTFNQELASVNLTDFTVYKTSPSAIDVTDSEVLLEDGVTKVILTLKEDIGYDATVSGSAVTVAINAKNTIENLFGVKPQAGKLTETVVDKIAPAIAKATNGTDDVDKVTVTSATSIEIEFAEKIDAYTLSALTFEVDGFTVKSASLGTDGKTVTLTLNVKKDADGNVVTPVNGTKVTQKYPLKDANGNSIKDLATKVNFPVPAK